MLELHLLGYDQDPLATLAQQIIDQHQQQLPNLQTVLVLLPQAQHAPRLRRALLKAAQTHGHKALLGPSIMGLRQWAGEQSIEVEGRVLGLHERELMLLETLIQHPQLYGEAQPWSLSEDLLALFDELSLQAQQLPEGVENFCQQLQQAYGIEAHVPSSLTQEAEMVHTLWQAWHTQLEAHHCLDPTSAYLLQLQASLNAARPTALYLCGFHHLYQVELEWLRRYSDETPVSMLLQGQGHAEGTLPSYHPDAPPSELLQRLGGLPQASEPDDQASAFFHCVFSAQHEQLLPRAKAFAQTHDTSPIADRIHTFAAMSSEEEAQAIVLQIRLWLAEGHQRIAIVSENRRLARRLRALLERHELQLQDDAGWALSTTSAATALERWLETLEEDFAHQSLLDMLKSPFVFSRQRESVLHATYRLEQDIILHEKIPRSLQRYRHHLQLRSKRLPQWMEEAGLAIEGLLATLEQAAEPLLPFLDGRDYSLDTLFTALFTSLERLEMIEAYEADEAGWRILQELRLMAEAAKNGEMKLNWTQFRAWIGRTLERFNFQQSHSGPHILFMGLEQSRLQRFDALVIAAAEQRHLPGPMSSSPFFNSAVRYELGLVSPQARQAQRFHAFRTLLQAADSHLISYQSEAEGEPILPSPWLERLQTFHRLAYAQDLEHPYLRQWLADSMLATQKPDPAREALQQRPRPSLPTSLLPQRISASAYQQLVNCPYQFFAARGLGLSAPENISEALQKADYGERIHLCLQAFHENVAGLPPAFDKPLTTAHRQAAIDHLEQISKAVFARDLEDNFLHRGWLSRWLPLIEAYIDWQTEQQQYWQVSQTEQQIHSMLVPGVELHGRLDRIDSHNRQLHIIDYKTGKPPKEEDVLSGEAVQLPFYALLAEGAGLGEVVGVQYLGLDSAPIKTPYQLSDQALISLRKETATRLESVIEMMKQGEGLPAWGDEASCGYCDMGGLCRRQQWQEEKVDA